jgi:hypothetical protein
MEKQIRRQIRMGCHSEDALVKLYGSYSKEEDEAVKALCCYSQYVWRVSKRAPLRYKSRAIPLHHTACPLRMDQ